MQTENRWFIPLFSGSGGSLLERRGFGVAWMEPAEGTVHIMKASDDFGRIMKEAGLIK